jgi:hypothetical protein
MLGFIIKLSDMLLYSTPVIQLGSTFFARQNLARTEFAVFRGKRDPKVVMPAFRVMVLRAEGAFIRAPISRVRAPPSYHECRKEI